MKKSFKIKAAKPLKKEAAHKKNIQANNIRKRVKKKKNVRVRIKEQRRKIKKRGKKAKAAVEAITRSQRNIVTIRLMKKINVKAVKKKIERKNLKN